MHLVPWQQPLQLFGPHGASTHACFVGSHTWPFVVQSLHLLPELPHASDEMPETHAFWPLKSVQQPAAHVVTSHVGWTLPHAWTCESQKSKCCAWQSLHV
jgi:hypothetical protein